jgi:hypothetical protein
MGERGGRGRRGRRRGRRGGGGGGGQREGAPQGAESGYEGAQSDAFEPESSGFQEDSTGAPGHAAPREQQPPRSPWQGEARRELAPEPPPMAAPAEPIRQSEPARESAPGEVPPPPAHEASVPAQKPFVVWSSAPQPPAPPRRDE